jgi:uncharacterized DUF497 family protein/predicted DNA binding CopG/RHH family protein
VRRRANRTKHGVWFEEAQSVFQDPQGRLFYDPEHSEGEDRFILVGISSAARSLVVVHCYREADSLLSPHVKPLRRSFDSMKKEYNLSKLKELKNPYPHKKKAVGINLSPEVLDYFKALAAEAGVPYQKLIDLYLLDCARKGKKLRMKWVA